MSLINGEMHLLQKTAESNREESGKLDYLRSSWEETESYYVDRTRQEESTLEEFEFHTPLELIHALEEMWKQEAEKQCIRPVSVAVFKLRETETEEMLPDKIYNF